MPAKVCILTSVHPAFDIRIFQKQGRSLARAGYSVTLIAQHNKNENVDGIRIFALPIPKNRVNRILGTWSVFKLARKQKADIYHFHDPELIPAGLLLKLITKSKVIYDVHEDYAELILNKSWLPKLVRRSTGWIFNIFEKSAARSFDGIVTATDHIKEKFRKTTAVSIKNYPLINDLPFKRGNSRPGDKKDRYVLIYAGSLGPQYCTREMVESMSLTAPSHRCMLKILGKFTDNNFEEEIKRLNGWSEVEYSGWCSRAEVMQNLAVSDAGLACDRFEEAISTKSFEYMAAGLPVITANYMLRKKIMEENNCGLTVDPLNPHEIADAIKYLIDHPDEAKLMGENGRKAVMEKYNWETENKKLLTLYENLISYKNRTNR